MLVSKLTDALRRGLPRRRKVQSERYYYTDTKLFEQSLDIYRPTTAPVVADPSPTNESAPVSSPTVIALVVGSAWLGHRAFVYGPTSWWNSSGPRAVAELGYVCVCIRHRGSFMKPSSILTVLFVAIMAAIFAVLVNATTDRDAWISLEEMAGERFFSGQASGFILAFVTGMVLIQLGDIGSASYEDMQNDVMDALQWLKANEDRLDLGPGHTPAQRENNSHAKLPRRKFVFGGYSSGGHVAATVAQQPSLWKDRNLPPPHTHCDCMLYISPVLTSSLEARTPSSESPTWLTDRIVQAVFGQAAPAIPSPIRTYEKSPPIPHVFLGCREEMFGLNWLDTFFCSSLYCDLLNGTGVESRHTAIHSDHWSILNSAQLKDSLRKELDWIECGCQKRK